MTWMYEDKEFSPTDEFLEPYQGFVYVVTEESTGKKYIGKKFFWKPKILPKNSKRKKRIKTKVQSDWRDYYGSSAEVKLLVEGGNVFRRDILRLCFSKGELTYHELREQMINDVLLKPDEYYNAFVGGKIHRKHVLKKK